MADFIEKEHGDFWLNHAIDVIYSTYGDRVSVEAKKKDLLKFGRTEEVQTSKTTIMAHKSGTYNETYISSNLIDTISSSSGSDTEELVIEGHTVDGSGNFTFVIQTKTLTGQTKAVLDTPLARCTRMYNNNGTDLVGTIYAYQDSAITAGVPDTGSLVHCVIPAGLNQSEKCATTISNADYWIITSIDGHVLEKTATFIDFHLEIRKKGKVFRDVFDWSAESGNGFTEKFKPYLIIPKNADVRVRGSAGANGKEGSASIQGVLARVMD